MKGKLLIVDDEKHIREGLQKALTVDGFDVMLSSDGREAIEMIGEGGIDLVITDLKMPRLSGEELMKEIIERYPYLPVIIFLLAYRKYPQPFCNKFTEANSNTAVMP